MMTQHSVEFVGVRYFYTIQQKYLLVNEFHVALLRALSGVVMKICAMIYKCINSIILYTDGTVFIVDYSSAAVAATTTITASYSIE